MKNPAGIFYHALSSRVSKPNQSLKGPVARPRDHDLISIHTPVRLSNAGFSSTDFRNIYTSNTAHKAL